jgi:hypothetical protein
LHSYLGRLRACKSLTQYFATNRIGSEFRQLASAARECARFIKASDDISPKL